MWLSFNFSPLLRPFGFAVSLSPSPWPWESWFRQFCSQHAQSLLLYISDLKTFLTVIYSKTYFTSSSHKYTNMYLDIAKKEYLQSRIYLYNTHCIPIVYFSFRGGKHCWSPLNQFHDLLMVCNLQMESHLFKECSVAYCHLYHWWGAVQGATEWLSLFKWHSRTKLCVVGSTCDFLEGVEHSS